MRGINKVILVGTLGRDPEAKYFADNGVASNFTIATSESWVDKNSGERIEQTEWHRITATGQRAEICNQYLRKGSKVYIEGSLRTRSWIDQDTGQEKFITEIRLEKLEILSSPQEDQQHDHQNHGYGSNHNNGYNSNQNNGYNSNQDYNNGNAGRQQQRGGYTNRNNRGNYPRNTNTSNNQNNTRRDGNQQNRGWQGGGIDNNSNYQRNNQSQNSGYQRSDDRQNNNFNNNQYNDNNYRRNNGNGNNKR